MLQATMTSPGVIRFDDVPEGQPQKGQIKVKMLRIGVCGSDVHVNHGLHPYTSYPVVQGHEVSGRVAELGEGVRGFQVGDLVTVQPQVVCGTCYPCTHGMYNVCESLKVMGFQTTGMASEYFICDAAKAIKLPEGMSPDRGAMIEPLAVAAHAVDRYGDVAGKRVLVLGGGPIGNLVAQTVKALGAADVVISELSEHRLRVARQCGIQTINPAETPLADAIAAEFGPDKADVIFECVGAEATIASAIACARKGSAIVIVGVVAKPVSVDMGFVQDHELTLLGTAMYRTENYLTAIELASTGRVELDPLISAHLPFQKYAEAYRLIDEQKDKVMKVIIDMEEI